MAQKSALAMLDNVPESGLEIYNHFTGNLVALFQSW